MSRKLSEKVSLSDSSVDSLKHGWESDVQERPQQPARDSGSRSREIRGWRLLLGARVLSSQVFNERGSSLTEVLERCSRERERERERNGQRAE